MTTTASTSVHLAFFGFLLPSLFSCPPKKQKGVIKKNILTAGVHQFIPSWVLSIVALNFQILFFSLLKSVPSLSLNSDGKSLHEQQKKRLTPWQRKWCSISWLTLVRSLVVSTEKNSIDDNRGILCATVDLKDVNRLSTLHRFISNLIKIWNALQFNNYLHLRNPPKIIKKNMLHSQFSSAVRQIGRDSAERFISTIDDAIGAAAH